MHEPAGIFYPVNARDGTESRHDFVTRTTPTATPITQARLGRRYPTTFAGSSEFSKRYPTNLRKNGLSGRTAEILAEQLSAVNRVVAQQFFDPKQLVVLGHSIRT